MAISFCVSNVNVSKFGQNHVPVRFKSTPRPRQIAYPQTRQITYPQTRQIAYPQTR